MTAQMIESVAVILHGNQSTSSLFKAEVENCVTYDEDSPPFRDRKTGWQDSQRDEQKVCERNSSCLRTWFGSAVFWSLPLVVYSLFFFAARKQSNHRIFVKVRTAEG